MTEIDMDAAREALRNAVDEPAQEQAPQTTESVSTSESVEQPEGKPEGLFYDVDPEQLSPEMRKMFDGMQSSYTQKNQELAEQRKQYDELGDVERIKQSLQFVDSLQDPSNLVQLHGELSEYLQQAGLTKAEADQAATSKIQEDSANADPFAEETVEDPFRQELDELKQFKERYEQEKLTNDIEASLTRQENMIRQQNPTYTDNDVQTIYQWSYAYGGDLMAAQQAFEGERNRIIQAYTETKAQVPEGVTSPGVGTSSQVPENLSWKDATDLAKRRLQAIEGYGGLDN